MNLVDIILLAIALGIDCLVVSFSQGLIFKHNRIKISIMLALTMGLFQGIMPFIGYIGAENIHKYIAPFSQWLVFSIFLVLGIKFIFEAFQEKKEEICCIGFKCLIGLGIATSIDALVAGASLNLTNTPIIMSAIIIGIISLLLSICGFWFGNFIKTFPAKYLEISGGLILILLAIKTIFM